jgi:hypothetical protein
MVICFQCSAEAKRALDSLLATGSYEDYSDVIAAALTNLAVLTAEVGQERSVVIDRTAHTSSSRESPKAGSSRRDLPTSEPTQNSRVAHAPPTVSAVPSVFFLSNTELSVELADMPSDVFAPGQAVPADRWIFGQYSKLLPAKASCRALANLLSTNRSGFVIEKVAPEIAEAAAQLAPHLEAHDARHGLTRDEAIATGFPSSGQNADRSRLRYANQFVASVNKHGQLSGLLADLKLINLLNQRTHRVQLTSAGMVFAAIENPIFEGLQGPPQQKFSEAEQEYLLQHISTHVPAEDFAYRTMLRAIRDGRDTPAKLDDIAREHVTDARKGELSNAFITTQRSGVTSRMIDLGLINRARDGVHVSYLITELGNEYAGRTAAA